MSFLVEWGLSLLENILAKIKIKKRKKKKKSGGRKSTTEESNTYANSLQHDPKSPSFPASFLPLPAAFPPSFDSLEELTWLTYQSAAWDGEKN